MLSMATMATQLVCPLSATASVTQQTITVMGQIVDQDGEPLIGATVRVKGAQSGSVTDIDGNFQIQAAS
ncbi:MAG: carboxypeptidase-like regulatory domain-containing protein, partial [Prevotella sp.]|nr:carboxypeptidase-like regulatory domain-containing protein [Prevotella sp.]